VTARQKRGVFAVIAGVMAIATVILTVTFFVTGLIFELIDYHPQPVIGYVINSVIGLLLCFLVLTIIGRYFGPRQRASQMGVFNPILEAMRKIASGDFSVKLEGEHFQDDGIFSTLAQSVNTMAVELNEMEQMRQEFISNVSHEIQSPLTSIRGFARALQNDRLSEEDRCHYLTIIETESMRLSKLTDNLLKLASLESDQVKFEPKAYRLDRQIRNLILVAEPQWLDKTIEMDVSLQEVTVCADEDLLSQVWINLIHNSIKFTPPDGKICVQLTQRDDKAEFMIRDTGSGISPEDQQHIFERFYKGDKSRERARGGSGLGLSIAQKIVTMHKGVIGVESQAGAGTTFTVSLPLNLAT
jgi:two-component system phosphate regulon sensor histidine kinase PhoR